MLGGRKRRYPKTNTPWGYGAKYFNHKNPALLNHQTAGWSVGGALMFGSNTHWAERYNIQNNQVGAVVCIMPTSFKVGEELEQGLVKADPSVVERSMRVMQHCAKYGKYEKYAALWKVWRVGQVCSGGSSTSWMGQGCAQWRSALCEVSFTRSSFISKFHRVLVYFNCPLRFWV